MFTKPISNVHETLVCTKENCEATIGSIKKIKSFSPNSNQYKSNPKYENESLIIECLGNLKSDFQLLDSKLIFIRKRLERLIQIFSIMSALGFDKKRIEAELKCVQTSFNGFCRDLILGLGISHFVNMAILLHELERTKRFPVTLLSTGAQERMEQISFLLRDSGCDSKSTQELDPYRNGSTANEFLSEVQSLRNAVLFQSDCIINVLNKCFDVSNRLIKTVFIYTPIRGGNRNWLP